MGIINQLNEKANSRDLTLRNFWANVPKVLFNKTDSTSTDSTSSNSEVSSEPVLRSEESIENVQSTSFPKPAQSAIKGSIDLVNADLTGLYKRKSLGLLTLEQQKEMKVNEQKKKKLKKKTLCNKINDQKRQLKNRVKRKANLQIVLAAYPESANILKTRNRAGRPRLENSQPELLKAIIDIATYGSGAHERRRSDVHRYIKKL